MGHIGDPLCNVQEVALEAEVRQRFPQSACARKGKHTANVICDKSNVILLNHLWLILQHLQGTNILYTLDSMWMFF